MFKKGKQKHPSKEEILAQEKVREEVDRKMKMGKDTIIGHFSKDNAQMTIIFLQTLQAAMKGAFEQWAMTKKVSELDLISQLNFKVEPEKAERFKWALEILQDETIKGATDILSFAKNEVDLSLMRMLANETVEGVLNYGQPKEEIK